MAEHAVQGLAGVSTPMNNQEGFDQFIVATWRYGRKTSVGAACLMFLIRCGYEGEFATNELMKEFGVVRRPDLDAWGHKNLTDWLCAAYPGFIDAVAKSHIATAVKLKGLRFVAKPDPPKRKYKDSKRKFNKEAARFGTEAAIGARQRAIFHPGMFNKGTGH